ncbi:hypothetical protein A3843_02095 [Pseudovibrio exalbescens]|uniref:Uncharacterized protein n=1 Tax=Pseudovibrio exalbescens TaxID=197461 RepID=A0A1U7JLW8_9HYPH|nr:hypothetical protein A3843_02095 [Pseudovibrio exalbescens]
MRSCSPKRPHTGYQHIVLSRPKHLNEQEKTVGPLHLENLKASNIASISERYPSHQTSALQASAL